MEKRRDRREKRKEKGEGGRLIKLKCKLGNRGGGREGWGATSENWVSQPPPPSSPVSLGRMDDR